MVEALRPAGRPRGVRLVGSMADLVPPDMIAETTEIFGAPFFNSFGSTEVDLPVRDVLRAGRRRPGLAVQAPERLL